MNGKSSVILYLKAIFVNYTMLSDGATYGL